MADFLEMWLQGRQRAQQRRGQREALALSQKQLDEQRQARIIDDERAAKALSMQEAQMIAAAAERKQQREDEERRFVAQMLLNPNVRDRSGAEAREAVGSVIYGEDPQKVTPSYKSPVTGQEVFAIPGQERLYNERANALATKRGEVDIEMEAKPKMLEAEISTLSRVMKTLGYDDQYIRKAIGARLAPNMQQMQPEDQALHDSVYSPDDERALLGQSYYDKWLSGQKQLRAVNPMSRLIPTPLQQLELNANELASYAYQMGAQRAQQENPGADLSGIPGQRLIAKKTLEWLSTEGQLQNPEARAKAIEILRGKNPEVFDPLTLDKFPIPDPPIQPRR